MVAMGVASHLPCLFGLFCVESAATLAATCYGFATRFGGTAPFHPIQQVLTGTEGQY